MDGRLVLVSSFDPAVRFRGWQAMERNKQIYALADAALVVNSDHGHGGTWAGATEQLGRLRYVSVYVRSTEEPCRGLEELVARGASKWGERKTPSELREIVFDDARPVPALAGPPQRELFHSEPEAAPPVARVRESEPTALHEPKLLEDRSESPAEAPAPGKNEMRLLRVMSGEMSRHQIRQALKLKPSTDIKKRYVDPCLDQGWIEMTLPEKSRSPKQRFLITPVGRDCVESCEDE